MCLHAFLSHVLDECECAVQMFVHIGDGLHSSSMHIVGLCNRISLHCLFAHKTGWEGVTTDVDTFHLHCKLICW